MKNKGRRHKAGSGGHNGKGWLSGLTRPIKSMASSEHTGKFFKKKWSKRVRGYFKSQTKDILNTNCS